MPPKKIPAHGMKVVDRLSEDDLEELTVPALGAGTIPKLQQYGYNGEAAAFFGVTLNDTNLEVAQGDIYLVGALYDDAVCAISAKNLWPDCPEHASINVDFQNLGVFQFRGLLVSDFVALEALETSYLLQGKAVDRDVFGTINNGGEACVRAFLHPEAPDYLRLEIRIFPMSRSELLKLFPHQQNHGIPGMKLASETVRFIPNVKHKIKKCGLPTLPFILKGDNSPLPGSLETQIRRSFHLTLSKGVKATGASSADSLAAKLEKLKSLTATTAAPLPFIWPVPAEFLSPPVIDVQGKPF